MTINTKTLVLIGLGEMIGAVLRYLIGAGQNLHFALYFLATNSLVLAGVFVGKMIAQRFAFLTI